ncbi:efflux RND transporter periplasmic adaptor subunit [Paenibacillus apis]|uniref:Efflux system component YknX n=1 Tax=Paenibacillus apis TaxID=1792174 RepID=A0A920CLV1_9BACL|nr:RND transporter [Paenibacillus apis]GIO43825.1 putative efflux system component YknX [Paenibacillus apis]
MELANEQVDRGRKRTIQIVFIVFMGLLLLLTFFGNTLRSLTLPKVRTEPLANGSLLFTIKGSGMLQPFTEAKLTNPAGWEVQKLFVKEGDRVKKGQKLIEYVSKTAERELETEIANLKRMNIELQNLQDQFIQSIREEDELGIRNARRVIETRKLDLDTQERLIDELRDRLARGRELTAPFNGIVTKLNAVEGMASSGEPDVLVSNDSLGYRLDILADSALLTRLEISVGTKIEVEVQTVQEPQTRILEGTITEMADAEPRIGPFESGEEAGQTRIDPRKLLRIKVVDPDLKGGEQAWINIEKRSRLEGLVVSNEAIHQERDGMFVYKVDEQRGALGNVFVARKVRIQSGESNDNETLIQADSLYEDDLLILESSEPLQDGNRIRLQ